VFWRDIVNQQYYNDQPPETIFYQGLALARLKKEDQARDRFHKLIAYGEKHLSDRVKIDYFAVSLPDLQIFDEDLDKKNRVHCLYMMALGHMGLGEHETARQQLDRALELDVNHSGIRVHLALQKQLAAEA
jgi:tetratricopeptide (TPR) repeat protein